MPGITVITPSVRPKGIELVARALKRQTFRDFEWIVEKPEGKPKGLYWTIYRDYNRAVRKAKGELIVSWQDYTYADPQALEKFWTHYQNEPKTIVTGVGNKYEDEEWTVQTWQDPRERDDQGSFYGCYYNDIEWNFCSIPKKAILEVGGFDERLDKYSSLCGLDVLDRLNIKGGWDFKIDQTNKSYSLEHGRLPGWEENSPFNGAYDKIRKEYLKNPVLT